MRNEAQKVLFRWDAAVIGAIALGLILVGIPICTGNASVPDTAAKAYEFVTSHLH